MIRNTSDIAITITHRVNWEQCLVEQVLSELSGIYGSGIIKETKSEATTGLSTGLIYKRKESYKGRVIAN